MRAEHESVDWRGSDRFHFGDEPCIYIWLRRVKLSEAVDRYVEAYCC
jgi:hypothetical protein